MTYFFQPANHIYALNYINITIYRYYLLYLYSISDLIERANETQRCDSVNNK